MERYDYKYREQHTKKVVENISHEILAGYITALSVDCDAEFNGFAEDSYKFLNKILGTVRKQKEQSEAYVKMRDAIKLFYDKGE